MRRSVLLCCAVLLNSASNSYSARILFVAGTASYSHQIVFQPIWRELSLRGHHVTVITPNPLDDPKLINLTEIDTSFVYEVREEIHDFSRMATILKDDTLKFAKFLLDMLGALNEEQLAHAEVQKLIKDDDEHFDLVMVECILPAMLAFGHRFGSPLIALTTLDAALTGHDAVGNPSHPVLNPAFSLPFNVPLTFTQRVCSTLYSVLKRAAFKIIMHREDVVVTKHFGESYPSVQELIKNVDMFFMNVNLAFHNVRPTVPAVVHIGGGIHIRPPRLLPKDLKMLLDDANQGVVYFSMGSNARTKILSKKFLEALTSAFAELPYQVLWKSDTHDLPGRPTNVLVKKWLPQQDVLRHPNVKLFITQGGLQSVEEAICFSLPVIVVPLFGDQFSNAIQIEKKGFGVRLDHHAAEKDTIIKAVVEVMHNPKYKQRASELADIAADQPMTSLEKAIWWTEYVLRHKGAKHLRSPAVDMPLHEYFLLDVIGFLCALTTLVSWAFLKLARYCCRSLRKMLNKRSELDVKKFKRN